MTGLEAGLGVVGCVSTAIAVYVGLKFDPLKEKVEQDRISSEKSIDSLSADFGRRLDALHSDKKDLERRMNEIEKNALHRSELDAMRRDMESAVERMGDRVMKHFDDTAARLERRLEKVEAGAS